MRSRRLLLRREPLYRLLCTLAAALTLGALCATPASAEFGLSDMSVRFLEADGSEATQAGSHPFEMRTFFSVNTTINEKSIEVIDGAIRNLEIILPAGFVGNPTAVPPCETIDFLSSGEGCADSTALGVLTVEIGGGLGTPGKETVPVYNLRPSPGSAAKLGFEVAELPQTVDVVASQAHPYNVTAKLSNTPQITEVISGETVLWGNPADPIHDSKRGRCQITPAADTCPANIPIKPFLTLPRTCSAPLSTTFRALSW
ncbi:MAG TPA: hypothetical protein VF729_02135, partial [Solirubrobacterales bacterium]